MATKPIAKLKLESGQIASFDNAHTWVILAIETINGAKLVSSGGAGSPAAVQFPAGTIVTGCTFIGIDNSGGVEVDATDPTNSGAEQNNSNIDFGGYKRGLMAFINAMT